MTPGASEEIGADLKNPIYGAAVPAIPQGVTPVLWACGVTPQRAAVEAKPDLMTTPAPGHGFIADLMPVSLPRS